MRIRLTPGYVLAFVCLACILGIGHELARRLDERGMSSLPPEPRG